MMKIKWSESYKSCLKENFLPTYTKHTQKKKDKKIGNIYRLSEVYAINLIQ